MTAEHVNTGTVAELIVNVDALQDKLFLFQFTPAVETTLRYTNGDGVQKEVTSMADGRAAIYEESGIQGDVYLEPQQGDTEYLRHPLQREPGLLGEGLHPAGAVPCQLHDLAQSRPGAHLLELIGNSYPNSEPFLTEDGAILAFLHDNDSTQLEDTKASYVQWNGASFGKEDIHAFPDPAGTDEGEGEGASAHAKRRVPSRQRRQPAAPGWHQQRRHRCLDPCHRNLGEGARLRCHRGRAAAHDEQRRNPGHYRVGSRTEWVTTRLTQNSSADMAPVVAVGGGKALVAWRAVAASDSGAPTEFDSYDTIQYKVYDFKEKNWSGPYTLYNGTSGAVKGMEAQMTESGAMAVAYTIEKGSTSSTTRAVTFRGRHHGNHVQPANRVRPHPAGRDRRLQSDQERPGDRR